MLKMGNRILIGKLWVDVVESGGSWYFKIEDKWLAGAMPTSASPAEIKTALEAMLPQHFKQELLAKD
jgi:hypothetical protein